MGYGGQVQGRGQGQGSGSGVMFRVGGQVQGSAVMCGGAAVLTAAAERCLAPEHLDILSSPLTS